MNAIIQASFSDNSSELDILPSRSVASRVTLQEIGEVLKGDLIAASDLTMSGEYPVVSGGDGIMGTHEHCNRRGAAIVISGFGNCGITQFFENGLWAGGNSFTFQTGHPHVDIRFVYYALTAKRADLNRLKQGTGLQYIPHGDLRRFSISLPSPEAQRRIASALSSVDAKIYALKSKKSAFEEYKRSLMQNLFSREIRFTGEDGCSFPDWVEHCLGGVFEWARSNSLSREHLLPSSSDGIANIHYGDIHSKFRSRFFQRMEDLPSIKTDAPLGKIQDGDFLKAGDVVFADASEDHLDVGKAIEILQADEKRLVAGLHTLVARPRQKLAPGFSSHLFQSRQVRRQIMTIAQGISVLGVSKKNMGDLKLNLPCYDEQKVIADSLSAIEDTIAVHCQKISAMDAFKTGILRKLFA